MLKKIYMLVIVLWLVYFGVCYVDILAHNLDFEPEYHHHWNLLTELWTKEVDPAQ